MGDPSLSAVAFAHASVALVAWKLLQHQPNGGVVVLKDGLSPMGGDDSPKVIRSEVSKVIAVATGHRLSPHSIAVVFVGDLGSAVVLLNTEAAS